MAKVFPLPHTDSANSRIDLNDIFNIHKPSCFLLRVKGESMTGIGIFEGDTVVVDRSIPPRNNHIVVAAVNGRFLIRRLQKNRTTVRLLPENPAYRAIEPAQGEEMQVSGSRHGLPEKTALTARKHTPENRKTLRTACERPTGPLRQTG